MTLENRTPIVYKGLIDIRFSDLDSYNHVNSKHYVDFVSTVRLNYLGAELGTPIEGVTSRGIGFFMTKSTINYRKPIVGLQKISASSHVSEISTGKVLVIPFQITSSDEQKIFADGVLEFAVIDLKTNRSTQTPQWVFNLFFK